VFAHLSMHLCGPPQIVVVLEFQFVFLSQFGVSDSFPAVVYGLRILKDFSFWESALCKLLRDGFCWRVCLLPRSGQPIANTPQVRVVLLSGLLALRLALPSSLFLLGVLVNIF
jgi:hypothetical protein